MEPAPAVTIDNVVDRLQIEDLLTSYANAIDNGDWATMVALFTDDGVWDLSRCGGIAGTPKEVAAWVAERLTGWTVNHHYIVNRDIRINGDTATGRSYFWNVMGRPAPDGSMRFLRTGGLYFDRYRRTERGWRIAERGEELSWFDGEWPQDVDLPS
ncbi:MAG TPA: nuclear transport factor 2 family protein [Acidimicrobiales bacterium]